MEKNAETRGNIEALLPFVEKPHRYLGNEINVVRKRPGDVATRVALAFPDVYEIGMSWTGQQILYRALNADPAVLAERVYAVWPDMEARMRAAGVPAFSLESWTPLAAFDILGVTLQYELVYTNLLTLLDLAGIPLRAAARRREHPLVLAGGPGAFNPEPMADFLDAVALGDGEEVFLDVCAAHRAWKASGDDRRALLERLARIEGVYVPSLYDVEYGETPPEGWTMPTVRRTTPTGGAPPRVRRRWLGDLDAVAYPAKPLVPLGKTVHGRLAVEVQRGCTRACRFCQAGYIYRPVRQRHPENVETHVREGVRATGYDEVSFLSLSIGDYGCLDDVLRRLRGSGAAAGKAGGGQGVLAISLPSIRADTLDESVVKRIATARKTGFTIAPEAGSPRLRRVVNKALTEEQIERAAETVFAHGWSHIKFYYMIGLPTETDDDVMGIVETARACHAIGRRHTRQADIVVSVSTFVPKPFTPFQWEPQIPRAEILRKQTLLRDELKRRRLTFRYHDSRESFLEAVFSRGDRRLGAVVEAAWRNGARFDAWQEHFDENRWHRAFATCGVEPEFYANRRIPVEEPLPWDVLDCGVERAWLIEDYENARKEIHVPDCATGQCYLCGVCDFVNIKNRIHTKNEGEKEGTDAADQTGETGAGLAAEPRTTAADTPAPTTPADSSDPSDPIHSPTPPAPPVLSAPPAPPDPERFRVRFEKRGPAAWIGHLDLMDTVARAFQCAGLRAAYTQGFHPKPKFAFGPALMTGAESLGEFFDVDLLEAPASLSWTATVNRHLPSGIALLDAHPIDRRTPSLGASIRGAEYVATERLPGWLPDFETRRAAVARFRAASRVEVATVKKTYDVRPFVAEAEATPEGFRLVIVTASGGRSAKPTDVLGAILGWNAATATATTTTDSAPSSPTDPAGLPEGGTPGDRLAGLRLVKVSTRFDTPDGSSEGDG